jgi:hypothetical protein
MTTTQIFSSSFNVATAEAARLTSQSGKGHVAVWVNLDDDTQIPDSLVEVVETQGGGWGIVQA